LQRAFSCRSAFVIAGHTTAPNIRFQRLLDQARELDPNNDFYHFVHACGLYEKGDIDQAESLLSSLMSGTDVRQRPIMQVLTRLNPSPQKLPVGPYLVHLKKMGRQGYPMAALCVAIAKHTLGNKEQSVEFATIFRQNCSKELQKLENLLPKPQDSQIARPEKMKLKSYFDHYQITRELLNNEEIFEHCIDDASQSTEEDLKKVIGWLAPQPCGYELTRIGKNGDGGYLVPNDLAGIFACFSPGVNNFKHFEDQLAHDWGIRSYMCDFSSSIDKFKTPLIEDLQFFTKKWLDLPGRPDSIDINQWVKENSQPDQDLILQIDIEGAEYRNILHIDSILLSQFRVIIIEFHGLSNLKNNGFLKGIFAPVIEKLLAEFIPVHVHPNNCSGEVDLGYGIVTPKVIEMTFLRKDRIKLVSSSTLSGSNLLLPHPLDDINVARNPPLNLKGLWLAHADLIQSELVFLRRSLAWFKNKNKQLNQAQINSEK
jgi:hypothetical protein